jgi:hypothetical protein
MSVRSPRLQTLARNPDVDLRLWQAWYFGKIPGKRTTITPASLYRSPALTVVFDGRIPSAACHTHRFRLGYPRVLNSSSQQNRSDTPP